VSEEKYYSADLTISIVEIRAESKEEAQAIIGKFVEAISAIKADQLSWDEADFTVYENVLDETKGIWVDN